MTLPLVDIHCHLLAGLDDGPRTWEDALQMCRIALEEGTQVIAATVHQNDHWPLGTPGRIRAAALELSDLLRRNRIPLTIVPSAEVMAELDLEVAWKEGRLLSVGDHEQFLLLEMPHGVFVDLVPAVERLREQGLRVILAHPERHPEWLHEPGAIEEMIDLGCLIQISSASITRPSSTRDARALRDWFRRGCVHLLGSDGHSPRSRAPRMAAAYEQIAAWTSIAVADRICSVNGLAVVRGQPVRVNRPRPRRSWWVPW